MAEARTARARNYVMPSRNPNSCVYYIKVTVELLYAASTGTHNSEVHHEYYNCKSDNVT